MSTWPLAIALKPILLMAFFLAIRVLFVRPLDRLMPDSKLKRLLFRRIS